MGWSESNVPWMREREKALRESTRHTGIYTVSGRRGDGSDGVKIKIWGFKSSEVIIWGDNLNNQEHPRVVGC